MTPPPSNQTSPATLHTPAQVKTVAEQNPGNLGPIWVSWCGRKSLLLGSADLVLHKCNKPKRLCEREAGCCFFLVQFWAGPEQIAKLLGKQPANGEPSTDPSDKSDKTGGHETT